MLDASVDAAMDAKVDGGCSTDFTLSLCDGTDQLRYLAMQVPTRRSPIPGHDFVFPNGIEVQAIDGQCRFWTIRERDNGRARAGIVNAGTAADIERALNEACFSDLVGMHERQSCDGPNQHIGVDDAWAVAVEACGEAEEERALAIDLLAIRVRDLLEPLSTEFSGPVALDVSVESDSDTEAACYANPNVWPLAGDVALGSELVNEPDATSLRSLAESFRSTPDLGFECSLLVPIEGNEMQPWRLLLRDSIPIENSDGSITF